MKKKYHDTQTYTQAEIDSNIAKLTQSLEYKVRERKEINASIRALKEQIEYWKEMDLSQTKIF